MKKIILFIATGAGSGYLPWFPGTWGTLAALLLYWPLRQLPPWTYLITLAALIFLAVWVSTVAEVLLRTKDCSKIVIDEFVGLFVALSFIPFDWKWIAIGFVLFRIFDITKPYPARLIQDKVPGGWGIVGDDLIAGLYANLVLQMIIRFFP